MIKKTQIDNDEINLSDVIQILWEGKLKIALAVVISVVSVIGYSEFNNKNIFTAITIIKPVTTLEENKYTLLNKINIIPKTENLRDSAINDDNIANILSNEENIDNRKSETAFSDFYKISKENLLALYLDELNEKKNI